MEALRFRASVKFVDWWEIMKKWFSEDRLSSEGSYQAGAILSIITICQAGCRNVTLNLRGLQQFKLLQHFHSVHAKTEMWAGWILNVWSHQKWRHFTTKKPSYNQMGRLAQGNEFIIVSSVATLNPFQPTKTHLSFSNNHSITLEPTSDLFHCR